MNDALATAYTGARPRLVRVAYSILGSLVEAEDVVSECWFRLRAADEREHVRDVRGWATVAVARASLDVLKSARVRREAYVGPWLPEPVVTTVDPIDRITLDESVRYALLVVLEQLTPAERTAWVLHDLFEMPFDHVAAAVGRTPAAVRQLARRARQHVAAGTPRLDVDTRTHDDVVGAFVLAAAGGDLAGLVAVLDPDVVLTSDGGGVVSAARHPVRGSDRVARFVLGIAGKNVSNVVSVHVNGEAGLAVMDGGRIRAVISLTVSAAHVQRVDIVMAPAKLPITS